MPYSATSIHVSTHHRHSTQFEPYLCVCVFRACGCLAAPFVLAAGTGIPSSSSLTPPPLSSLLLPHPSSSSTPPPPVCLSTLTHPHNLATAADGAGQEECAGGGGGGGWGRRGKPEEGRGKGRREGRQGLDSQAKEGGTTILFPFPLPFSHPLSPLWVLSLSHTHTRMYYTRTHIHTHIHTYIHTHSVRCSTHAIVTEHNSTPLLRTPR